MEENVMLWVKVAIALAIMAALIYLG